MQTETVTSVDENEVALTDITHLNKNEGKDLQQATHVLHYFFVKRTIHSYSNTRNIAQCYFHSKQHKCVKWKTLYT